MSYDRLHNEEAPELPPEYDQLEQENNFEQFEIDEDDIEIGALPGEYSSMSPRRMLARAGEAGQRLASKFNNNIILPFKQALDPVYEIYVELNRRAEAVLSKIGNPLIVKRLLYVIFIASIIYLMTMSGTYDNYSTISYYGNFFDTQKLYDYIDCNVAVSRMQENLEYFSSIPHLSGTAGDLVLARYVEKYIKDSALTVDSSSTFTAYANYPDVASLKLFKSDNELLYEANLYENIKTADDSNGSNKTSYLAFNPGSKSGKVKGHLIYANYGFENDFKALEKLGVIIEGSIVMIKYHGNPVDAISEADKVDLAHKYKANGVIFISDPWSKTYHYDSMDSIERQPLGIAKYAPGNLLNPGEGDLKLDYNNLNLEEAWDKSKATVKIPSLPISWADAIKLLETIKDHGKRLEAWDLTFMDDEKVEIWTGNKEDNSNYIELVNEPIEKPNKEMWNIVGELKGKEQDNMAIIIGAQRDSAGRGAAEANSGTTILLEIMSVMSHMVHQFKWRPLRSVYFVSFDGTDYNLAGATELAQSRNENFRRNAYAYIDLSNAISGPRLDIASDPILWDIVAQSMTIVNDPTLNISLLDTNWNGNRKLRLPREPNKNYIPFITYDGIPVIDLKFSGGSYPGGSVTDDFQHFEKAMLDPDLKYHKTLATLLCKIIVHLVEKPILPYDISGYVSGLNEFAKDLRRYAKWMKSEQGGKGDLDFNKLETALSKMKRLGREHTSFVDTWQEIVTADGGAEPNLLAGNRWDWNSKISVIQKTMLSNSILDRPFYKNVLFGRQVNPPHMVDTPDSNVDFQFSTFPGVRDAIERGDWANAQQQLNMVSDMMEDSLRFFLLQ